ncbi:hypothetical protein UFOVP247_185 [uncultured Caudovirales phage]|uniref:Uncharacterized protein n=1 Tax=uncultured Caudovirales phage TaxID=2100421 RepID=A0A6J7WXE7_9CAUD|nr:hypothetical protein UFOVP247_185 [uncultured Caudovirales phage]
MKTNISFAEFNSIVSGRFQAVESGKIFFVKAGKAGKIELNQTSGTWTVGSGSGKRLLAITKAVREAGFEVIKENRGWTVLKFGAVEQFNDLLKAVESAVPSAAPAAKASKPAPAKPVKRMTEADLAAIRAKNLETIKAVHRKLQAVA